jgi:hypothetical protein
MRYKVKVERSSDFRKVKDAASALTRLFVVSEERRTLSTGDLSEGARAYLASLGAKVTPDIRYDADRSAVSTLRP